MKCGFTEETREIEDDIDNEVFNALFKELSDLDCETTAEEYIDFDVEACSSVPTISSDTVDWRVISVQKCVAEYLCKESGKDDIEVVSSDDSSSTWFHLTTSTLEMLRWKWKFMGSPHAKHRHCLINSST